MTTEQEKEYASMLLQLMGYSFAQDLQAAKARLKDLTPEEREDFAKGLNKAEQEISAARRELLDLNNIYNT